jgi:hypothetical protein
VGHDRWLDELDYDSVSATVLEQYAAIARTGTPRCDTKEFVDQKGRYFHYRGLLLRLSDDGITPNILLGMQKAIGFDGFKVAIPKWM